MEDFIKIENHGFQAPEIKDEDYLFGAEQLPLKVVREDGQYDDFIVERELQKKRIETMNCSNYGTHNAMEIYEKAAYGTENNWSERYSGVLSGTTHYGNSPHKVAETIRKHGCIPESELPFDGNIRSWNEYYSPNPMLKKYLDMGLEWLGKYKLLHEYVFSYSRTNLKQRQEAMMDSLKYSPLGVSVLAWKYRNGLYYKNYYEQDNHWCVCTGYVKGRHWKIFDTYDNVEKKLEWGYNFNFAKKYYLEKIMLKKRLVITEGKLKDQQFAIYPNNDVRRIPDEATLHFLLKEETVSQDKVEAKDLTGYNLLPDDYPSLPVCNKVKELMPVFIDAFEDIIKSKESISSNSSDEKKDWWEYIKNLFNK